MALIPEILPGQAVSLRAEVALPENVEDQTLINEVSVVTAETGERTGCLRRGGSDLRHIAVSGAFRDSRISAGANSRYKGLRPGIGAENRRRIPAGFLVFPGGVRSSRRDLFTDRKTPPEKKKIRAVSLYNISRV